MTTRQRDIEGRHELAIGQQIIDPRPIVEKFAEWLSIPSNLFLVAVPAAAITVLAPPLALVTVPFLLFSTVAHVATKSLLPIRYPQGTTTPEGKAGDGILYIGEVASTSPFENFKEIWLSDDDLRKHMLILGSTGSGKSEALKAIFYNALNWSSGFFIADGKADNKLPTDVYTMVRSNGRDQDMLILNFLLAGKTPEQVRRSRRRRTNKLNPFSSADADTIIQMGSNLLPKVEGDAKNWQEKALNLWRSVVAAVCYKRDTQSFDLSVATFIDYMSLHKVEELYIEGYQEALSRNGEWSYGFAGIKNYLESGCPAYQVAKLLKKNGFGDDQDEDPGRRQATFGNKRGGGKETEQDSMAYEQHSYRTNQLMPVLNLLDKTYGFIFRDKYPEIDMSDVTLRNRVLVMLIPSLEKSAAEAENLGKLAIACLRVMMSKNLGAEVEGSHEELLGSKATNSPYPYVVALDELAYYFSDGIAVMFAQARSLGTCMIAAAQDLEKLTEGNKAAEAGAMLANQVTKFFMRIDDTGKTAEMIQKVVGKATVAVRRSYRFNSLGYSRKSDVDVTEVERVSPQRLKKFEQGEGIVDAMGRTHFMRWFYMGRDIEQHRVDAYFVNRFLQVAPPTAAEVAAHSIAVDELNDPFRKGEELVRRLRQEVGVDMRVPFDPVLSAIGAAAGALSPHLDAETRSIALYVVARDALQAEGGFVDSGGVASGRRGGQAHKQAPLQAGHDGFAGGVAQPADAHEGLQAAVIAPDLPEAAPDFLPEEDDPLSFLKMTPFERKPADEVLGLVAPLTEALPRPERERAEALLDPLDAAFFAGGNKHYLADPSNYRGGLLNKLVAAPEAMDPATALSLMPKDDWIGDALRESETLLAVPRSSDNTVVGLNTPTLRRVEEVEELMNSPRPDQAAKALERVVAARVTPQTIPQEPADVDDVDAFFTHVNEQLKR
jgi:intracellular multiplication protein IcmO